jgi:tetratricopeptide (TPR) repeat protein
MAEDDHPDIDLLQENNMPVRQVGLMALPLLEPARRARPDDLAAADALSAALVLTGRTKEALAVCERVLARDPNRESTLVNATAYAQALGQREVATDYCRRSVALNPWSSAYRYRLARLLSERQQWAEAAAECRELLRRNPHHYDARSLLVRSLARGGDVARARAELQALLAQRPPDPDGLRRSFEDLLK